MTWLFANRNWIGAGILLLALAIFAGFVYNWREGYLERDQLKVQLKQERVDHAELIRLRDDQERISNNRSRDYETQLAQLKVDNTALSTRAVRLCKSAARLPAVPNSAPVVANAPTEGLQQEPGGDTRQGPDIGPALFRLALEADECSIRLSQLQAWWVEQMISARSHIPLSRPGE